MRVTIEKQTGKNITINSETKNITIGQTVTSVVINSSRGPRGPKGDPGDFDDITPEIADTIVGQSTLIDGEVNGMTPLAFYNLAKGT